MPQTTKAQSIEVGEASTALRQQEPRRPRGIRSTRETDRRTEILEAARLVLIEEGYPELSLRKVAKRAAIHLKTLQHYFETKAVLIQEIVPYIGDRLTREYSTRSAQLIAANDYLTAFQAMVQLALEDGEKSQDTRRAFLELWALAGRDEDAKDAVDAIYARHRYELEVLIACLNPRLPRGIVVRRATMVGATISGIMLYIDQHRPDQAELAELKAEVVARLSDTVLRKS